MLRSHPLALFLTWRTYGTWLPGDERGWVDERRNSFGEAVNPPDFRLEQAAQGQMTGRPVEFTPQQRLAVDQAIREACEFRGWAVVALNVRSNHVHLVLGAEQDPAKVLNLLKVRVTTVLRATRQFQQHAALWARGGSKRQIWDEASLEAAIDYVLNRQ